MDQKEKNKKNRGRKGDKANDGDTQRSAAPAQAAPKAGKKGKGKGDDKADIEELEKLIDELNENLELKDEQFKQVRDDLDKLNVNYKDIMTRYLQEKVTRTGLESNKLKYIMQKELA